MSEGVCGKVGLQWGLDCLEVDISFSILVVILYVY